MTAETPQTPDTPGNESAESAPSPAPRDTPEVAAVESAPPPAPLDAPGNVVADPAPSPAPLDTPGNVAADPAPSLPSSSDTPEVAAAESAPSPAPLPSLPDAPGNAAAEPAPSLPSSSDKSEVAAAESDPPPPPLPAHLAEIAEALGPEVEVTEQFGRILATVPSARWVAAMTAARDGLGADFLDWLTGVDELEAGYLVAAFVASTADRGPGKLGKARGLILRTRVAKDAGQGAKLASVTGVYRGAAWHERETFEMFGIEFTGHEGLKPLLLPDGFEGHPLRKDFVLAARVAKAWPGAKEPGESDHHPAAASPGRRRMLPPGVPGEEWLKPYRAPDRTQGDAGPEAAE